MAGKSEGKCPMEGQIWDSVNWQGRLGNSVKWHGRLEKSVKGKDFDIFTDICYKNSIENQCSDRPGVVGAVL